MNKLRLEADPTGLQLKMEDFISLQEGDLIVFDTNNTTPVGLHEIKTKIGEFVKFVDNCVIIKYLGTQLTVDLRLIKEGELRRAYETENILWKLQNEDGNINSFNYSETIGG